MLTAIVLMNFAGFDRVSDVARLEEDKGLRLGTLLAGTFRIFLPLAVLRPPLAVLTASGGRLANQRGTGRPNLRKPD